MVRTSGESQVHKQAIEKIARAYERSGFVVKADHIKSFAYPGQYPMLKPDVVAEKKDLKVLIEVETQSSIGTKRDKRQRQEFGNWAKQSRKRDFRREIAG